MRTQNLWQLLSSKTLSMPVSFPKQSVLHTSHFNGWSLCCWPAMPPHCISGCSLHAHVQKGTHTAFANLLAFVPPFGLIFFSGGLVFLDGLSCFCAFRVCVGWRWIPCQDHLLVLSPSLSPLRWHVSTWVSWALTTIAFLVSFGVFSLPCDDWSTLRLTRIFASPMRI